MPKAHHLGLLGAAWLAALAGCSSDTIELPTRPDPPIPQHHPVDSVQFACRHWVPGQPAPQRALFDIHYGSEADPATDLGPSPWQLEEVRRFGGVVVREFNLPIVRASIEVDSIPLLRAWWCSGVPDPSVATARVYVVYLSTVTEEDLERLRALGGSELTMRNTTRVHYITGILPDDAIPAAREDPRVDRILGESFACPLDETPRP